ncbi:hypothetical protein CVV68_19790 [Arthrobacter livingstonensis]|uniref:Uncharacterized protein n=1 Tax=Arthrobacter livingstonensis TaxID=670078 RepID=A0A2V5L4L5_9MICC|nr:hypothetical protein CVV68_19790 [Arthrobacter livingstonensis]
MTQPHGMAVERVIPFGTDPAARQAAFHEARRTRHRQPAARSLGSGSRPSQHPTGCQSHPTTRTMKKAWLSQTPLHLERPGAQSNQAPS